MSIFVPILRHILNMPIVAHTHLVVTHVGFLIPLVYKEPRQSRDTTTGIAWTIWRRLA